MPLMRRRTAKCAIVIIAISLATIRVLFPEQPGEADAETLGTEVDQLMREGKYAEAVPRANKLLSICERTVGAEHPATGIILDKLGRLYDASGDYAHAESTLQQAVGILEKTRGANDRHTTNALNDLAELYRHTGAYAKAESIYKRVLETDRASGSKDERNTAAVMANLASVYTSMGEYAKAEQIYLDALAVCEKTVGPNSPDTATVCNQLAHLYSDSGEFRKAEPLYLRALKIDETVLGREDPNVAIIVGGLGALYRQTGDLFNAESAFKNALQISERTVGPEHPTTAQACNNLAAVYEDIGDYAKAQPLYEHALTIREKTLGENNPDVATTLNNLAGLYRKLGNYSQAGSFFERSLAIYEKVFGRNHHRVALALNNLADLHLSLGNYAKAEPLYKRALSIYQSALGPKHPATAVILNNLGALCSQARRYGDAAPLYRRSAEISEQVAGPDHIQTATALRNLAYAYLELGKKREAAELATRVNSAEEEYLRDVLSFTSERQRLAYQQTTNPYSLPAKLNAADMLAKTILRQKGIVLDSLLEDRLLLATTNNRSEARKTIAELAAAKERLMQVSLTALTAFPDRQRADNERQKLSERVEQMEAQLGRESRAMGKARRSLNTNIEQVQQALRPEQALVEFLRYADKRGENQWELCYGAIVIRPSGKPQWIPLGKAAVIDDRISLYKQYVRGEGEESALIAALRDLHDEVWAPVEKLLPSDVKTVAISPDGELNFISFATLLNSEKKFLAETYSIRYVASGRDLLREFRPASNRNAIVFANPDFERTIPSEHSTQPDVIASTFRAAIRDLQDISLPPLPGTADEATGLQRVLKETNTNVKIFSSADATKAELRRVESPRILHIATHGFFLPETELGREGDLLQLQVFQFPSVRPMLSNPMYRSGIALAGAQNTLRSWSRGEIPSMEDNGILTADEAGELKLDGTWLVVLSGCDTGIGTAHAGEGVLGLRRGFVQAGAQNLLMTLWPIGDRATIEIMLDFYETAEKTGNAAQALADVQRKWLVKLRDERSIRTAVRFAGPFIMSSQGHL
jgi:tetratricopeptide (TPR) repeat protein